MQESLFSALVYMVPVTRDTKTLSLYFRVMFWSVVFLPVPPALFSRDSFCSLVHLNLLWDCSSHTSQQE